MPLYITEYRMPAAVSAHRVCFVLCADLHISRKNLLWLMPLVLGGFATAFFNIKKEFDLNEG